MQTLLYPVMSIKFGTVIAKVEIENDYQDQNEIENENQNQ